MSEATPILHMLSPQKHMSPFDVNMAADAGWKVIVPYINVTLEEVTALTQDAIFSRPPNYGVRTGFFIGGKDAILALDMLEAVQKAGPKLTPAALVKAANSKFTYEVENTVGPTTFPAAHSVPTPCGALVASNGTAFAVKVPYSCGRVVPIK